MGVALTGILRRHDEEHPAGEHLRGSGGQFRPRPRLRVYAFVTPDRELAPIVYLLILLVIGVLYLGAAAFFLDAYRVPVIVPLILWISWALSSLLSCVLALVFVQPRRPWLAAVWRKLAALFLFGGGIYGLVLGWDSPAVITSALNCTLAGGLIATVLLVHAKGPKDLWPEA